MALRWPYDSAFEYVHKATREVLDDTTLEYVNIECDVVNWRIFDAVHNAALDVLDRIPAVVNELSVLQGLYAAEPNT